MQNDPNRTAELTQVFARLPATQVAPPKPLGLARLPATQVAPPKPLGRDDRKRRLDERVQENIVRGGARVESRGDYEAVLIQGRRPNHVLHLLLTVFTLGAWSVVWIIVAATHRERRALVTVDDRGAVDVRPVRR